MGWDLLEKGYVQVCSQMRKLTNESCTVPQKHVAVASSSFDQPSWVTLARGKYGSGFLGVKVEAAIVECFQST